jgi:F-type H+-transporting ATPase subunit b
MEATLNELVQLLIKSIPTIAFFIFLCIYLNLVYFKPIAKVLEERRNQTEGSRELAQKAFEAADKKTTEFERALQLARIEISQENEAIRKQWTAEQENTLARARADAEKRLAEAKAALALEIERAKSDLDVNVDELSTRILEAVAGRRAA